MKCLSRSFLAFVFLMGLTAFAKKEAPPPPADKKKPKAMQVSFDDELVTGEVTNPSADFLMARKEFNYKKMIKLRENFIPEAQKGKSSFGISD